MQICRFNHLACHRRKEKTNLPRMKPKKYIFQNRGNTEYMTMEPRRLLNILVPWTLFDRDCIEANKSLQISSVSQKKITKETEKVSNKSTFPKRWNKIHRSREPRLSNIFNVIRQWFYRSKCVWMILHQSLLSLRHLHNCRFFQYEYDSKNI